MSFFTLADREFTGNVGGESDTSIDLISTIARPNNATGWINDSDQDPFDYGAIFDTAEVAFSWDSAINGDALAWSGLVTGDSGSMTFANYNGAGIDAGFQFVTYQNDEWTSVATFGDQAHMSQSFDFIFIPLPTAAAMSAVGVIGLALGVRRRAVI